MSLVHRTVCKCEQCGHEWLPENVRDGEILILPARCPSRKCRSSAWNRSNETPTERMVRALAEKLDAEIMAKPERCSHRMNSVCEECEKYLGKHGVLPK